MTHRKGESIPLKTYKCDELDSFGRLMVGIEP